MSDEAPDDWTPVMCTTGYDINGRLCLLAFKPGYFSLMMRNPDGTMRRQDWWVETPEDLLGDDFIDMRPGQEDKFKEGNPNWWKEE